MNLRCFIDIVLLVIDAACVAEQKYVAYRGPHIAMDEKIPIDIVYV